MRWTARDARSLGVGLAYLAPSFLLFAAFVFIPLGRTFYLSFFYTRQSGAISAAVGALLWLLLFNPSLGLLNYVLSRVGIPGPDWLIQPNTAILAVAITTVWLTLGTNIIVLLAGLQGVPEEIYEAARLDGAQGLRMFSRITVPMVSPSLFFLLVVDTVGVLQVFTQIHLLTRGGPVDATRTLVYSIYLDAFQNFQFGYASAESVVLFVLVLCLTVIQFRFIERRVHYQ